METTAISKIGRKAGATATVQGWLYNKRSSGKIQFLIVRDGDREHLVRKQRITRVIEPREA